MNINEQLFSPPFCLDIFKVIYNKNEYLFVGRLTKEELIAINKIKENKNITLDERSKLNLRYGKTGVDILKHKLTPISFISLDPTKPDPPTIKYFILIHFYI